MSDETASHALRLRHVAAVFGGEPVIRHVDLDIAPGELVGLVGRSGSGKSVLLRIAATLEPPAVGFVEIGGQNAAWDPAAALARLGYVPDPPALDRQATIAEHLGDVAGVLGLPAPEGRVEEVLAFVGLAGNRDAPLGAIPPGLRLRAALARALLPQPALLLLDEPLARLDPKVRPEIVALLSSLAQEGAAVLLATTAVADVAESCHRVAVLHGGRIVADAAPGDLVSQVGVPSRIEVVLATSLGPASEWVMGLSFVDEVEARGNKLRIGIRGGAKERQAVLAKVRSSQWPVESFEEGADGLVIGFASPVARAAEKARAHPGVLGVQELPDRIRISVKGGPKERAAVIASLNRAGLPLVSVGEAGGGIEEAIVALTEG
ncbi:MAG: ATP-binding cassette domain-containing protein [Planctomycetales bacterium]|nr:ATP-binding cassette domain-containing protein [Planctomycetales bacterium]